MTELWIVVTNANSWGKDSTFKNALGNAIKNASRMASKIEAHFYHLSNVTDAALVFVDELGTLHHPTGAVLTKLTNQVLPDALVKSYTAFDDECDDLRYSPAFDKAFDTI